MRLVQSSITSHQSPIILKQITKNDKRTINGWALFDWANSAYALTIMVAVFPPYYEAITKGQTFLGLSNTALYSLSISLAYLIVSIQSPILSGIADYGGRKLQFMKFFSTLGAVCCIALFFFDSADKIVLGIAASILAAIGFASSLVFYNSFLPEIATEDQMDSVSAKGFAYGFGGSVILLLFNLAVIQQPTWFGLSGEGTLPVRISFLTVGIWWLIFAAISFRRLPQDRPIANPKNLFRRGIDQFKEIWGAVQQQKNLKTFLLAFFLYSAGVQTVIMLASLFGSAELKFGQSELIVIILLLQLLAIAGVYLFATISKKRGNISTIIIILSIWIVVCIAAFIIVEKNHFYIVVAFIGLVMGGIQSLSRSTYAKLLPTDTDATASYFSFYDVLEKLAIVSGTLVFGFVDQLTGGMRNSILFLTVFFLAGIFFLSTVKMKRAD